jgi:hypothetical protein
MGLRVMGWGPDIVANVVSIDAAGHGEAQARAWLTTRHGDAVRLVWHH